MSHRAVDETHETVCCRRQFIRRAPPPPPPTPTYTGRSSSGRRLGVCGGNVGGYRAAHKRQQARLQEDRDFRERLKRKKRGAAESSSDEPPPAAGVDFIFFRWFLSYQLHETENAVQSALSSFASGGEAAAAALFSAAEAAGATAALLDCARAHDFHHSHNSGNYGGFFRFWDWACGTDAAYRRHLRAKRD